MATRRSSTDARATRWAWRIVAVLALAAAAVATVRDATIARDVAVPAPGVAVFTGEFDHGAPVYRLPAITVSGARESDDGLAQAQARAPACPGTTTRDQDRRLVVC